MSTEYRVIPSKVWFSPSLDRKASIYGAVPWIGEQGDWQVINQGWVIEVNHNGRITVGCGRPPFPNKADADALVAKFNARNS